MYLVQVVQSANVGLHHGPARSISSDTTPSPPSAASGAELVSRAASTPVVRPRTALVPRLGSQCVAMMAPHQQHAAAAAGRGRGLRAAAGSAGGSSGGPQQEQQQHSATNTWEDGAFVIQLPPTSAASDGSSSSTVIPLGAGDPARPPPLVMTSVQQSSLAVRGGAASAVQPRRVQPAGPLQAKTAADPPAPRSPARPLGLLRWPTGSSSSLTTQQQQQQWWVGGPIGGTLYLNPPLPADEAASDSSSGSTAVQAAPVSALLPRRQAGAPVAVAGRARSSHPLAILPAGLKQHGSSVVQWGSPIGGTLYINPQAPLDFGHEGPFSWGGGGSGNGGGGSGGGALGSGAGHRQAGAGTAAGAAGRLAGSGVPPGLGLARAGVALMAAMAAGAVALYSCSDKRQQATTAPPATHTARSVGGGAAASLPKHLSPSVSSGRGSAAAVATAPAAEAGSGYHEWMVGRLSAALDGFAAEQAMLRAELALLANIQPAARTSSLWRGARRLLTLGAADRAEPAAAGLAADASLKQQQQQQQPEEGAAAAPLSAADVAARLAEIREQLESIDTLRSALGAELAEQQQLLAAALEAERRAAQQHRSVLVSR